VEEWSTDWWSAPAFEARRRLSECEPTIRFRQRTGRGRRGDCRATGRDRATPTKTAPRDERGTARGANRERGLPARRRAASGSRARGTCGAPHPYYARRFRGPALCHVATQWNRVVHPESGHGRTDSRVRHWDNPVPTGNLKQASEAPTKLDRLPKQNQSSASSSCPARVFPDIRVRR